MTRKWVDISVVANEDCDHEVDFNTKFESCDGDLHAHYRAACFYVRCKKCNGAGICADDTGEFWMDEFGEFV